MARNRRNEHPNKIIQEVNDLINKSFAEERVGDSIDILDLNANDLLNMSVYDPKVGFSDNISLQVLHPEMPSLKQLNTSTNSFSPPLVTDGTSLFYLFGSHINSNQEEIYKMGLLLPGSTIIGVDCKSSSYINLPIETITHEKSIYKESYERHLSEEASDCLVYLNELFTEILRAEHTGTGSYNLQLTGFPFSKHSKTQIKEAVYSLYGELTEDTTINSLNQELVISYKDEVQTYKRIIDTHKQILYFYISRTSKQTPFESYIVSTYLSDLNLPLDIASSFTLDALSSIFYLEGSSEPHLFEHLVHSGASFLNKELCDLDPVIPSHNKITLHVENAKLPFYLDLPVNISKVLRHIPKMRFK